MMVATVFAMIGTVRIEPPWVQTIHKITDVECGDYETLIVEVKVGMKGIHA
jgi:hypothetical protein